MNLLRSKRTPQEKENAAKQFSSGVGSFWRCAARRGQHLRLTVEVLEDRNLPSGFVSATGLESPEVVVTFDGVALSENDHLLDNFEWL